jgi:hypothetical protein
MDQNELHNIYTIGHLRNETDNNDLEALIKRAKAKYSQKDLMKYMSRMETPFASKYQNTISCSSFIFQNGNVLTSRYCKHRWCKICNRIRTAKLLAGYSEVILNMIQPQFVTLTVQNVVIDRLESTIKEMIRTIKLIQDLRRKKKQILLRCIRKLECTYNATENTYHPHFHFIIEGEEAANDLLSSWVNRYPDHIVNIKGQDIRPADKPIELFKYFAKLTAKHESDTFSIVGDKVIRNEYHYPEALDLIFRCIENFRVVQTMGGIRMVKDDIDEVDAQTYNDIEIKRTLWLYNINDWFDTYTGDKLTGYVPNRFEQNFSKRIRRFEA